MARARQSSPRQSKAYHRRQDEAREQRVQRRIVIGAAAVLLVAGILAAVGYVVANYRPRHAQVLTIGDQRFEADTVAKRAAFYLTSAGTNLNQAVQRDPVAGTLEQIVREETVLQAGPSEASAVSEADLEAAIRKRIDVPAEAAKDAYTKKYADILNLFPVSRAEFERTMRAAVVTGRLMDTYRAALPDAGPQLDLQAARSLDQDKVKQIHDAAVAGADFEAETQKAGATLDDIGWRPIDALTEREALAPLQKGQYSDVLQLATGDWAVYRVVTRDERRTYDVEVGKPGSQGYQLAQKDMIASTQLSAWVKSQQETLHTKRDLASGREAWILKQTRAIVQRMVAAQARTAPNK